MMIVDEVAAGSRDAGVQDADLMMRASQDMFKSTRPLRKIRHLRADLCCRDASYHAA